MQAGKLKFRKYTFVQILVIIFILIIGSPYTVMAKTPDPYRLGLAHIKNRQWEKAIEEFNKALEANPDHALTWANLGVSLSQSDKHKEALLAYEKALELGYSNALFHYNRGLSFAKVNLLEEAEQEMVAALKENPRLPRADFDLGIIYKLQGQWEKAFAQVKKLYPRNEKLAYSLFEQLPPSYKIVTIDQGGYLTGTVSLKGKSPRARSFHLIHAPNIEFCSRISDGKGHRLLFDFTVSDDNKLKDTVVALLNVPKGKPFPYSQKMQAFQIDRCRANQYVMGINNGEKVLIENFDPIKHEIVTYEINAKRHVQQKSNKSVVAETSQIRTAFIHPDSKEFLIKCNLHPFLQTRAVMVDNPYYAITDENGKFEIKDIPPGTYEVMAWHPFIPTQYGKVTINPIGTAEIDFEFDSKNIKRKLYHDDLEGYRFQPWYDSFENFYGGPRVDDPVEILQKF